MLSGNSGTRGRPSKKGGPTYVCTFFCIYTHANETKQKNIYTKTYMQITARYLDCTRGRVLPLISGDPYNLRECHRDLLSSNDVTAV